ncbi:MAG: heme-binding protein [Bacteroidales bacterium]|nr:heme-binding protein [Bacteroidales bacterium]
MKTAKIYFPFGAILLIIQSYTTMAFAETEKQKYSVVHSEKDFEIRFYPSAILATVYSDARNYKDLAYPGFSKLAGYIFGGNESDTKISMTSPVHMDMNTASMSFVMPSSFTEENLPRPDDPGVKIERTDDVYVAAIRFSGYASDKDIRNYSEKLKILLEGKGINWYGNFRYLGYNPPYQPFGRKNEIIVNVEWNEEK